MRRVGAERAAPSVRMKRSMTEGDKRVSALSARPTLAPNDPSLPAANNSALARAGLSGEAASVTSRAKRATSAPSDLGA